MEVERQMRGVGRQKVKAGTLGRSSLARYSICPEKDERSFQKNHTVLLLFRLCLISDWK